MKNAVVTLFILFMIWMKRNFLPESEWDCSKWDSVGTAHPLHLKRRRCGPVWDPQIFRLGARVCVQIFFFNENKNRIQEKIIVFRSGCWAQAVLWRFTYKTHQVRLSPWVCRCLHHAWAHFHTFLVFRWYWWKTWKNVSFSLFSHSHFVGRLRLLLLVW